MTNLLRQLFGEDRRNTGSQCGCSAYAQEGPGEADCNDAKRDSCCGAPAEKSTDENNSPCC